MSPRYDTSALVDDMQSSRRARLFMTIGVLVLVLVAFGALFLLPGGEAEVAERPSAAAPGAGPDFGDPPPAGDHAGAATPPAAPAPAGLGPPAAPLGPAPAAPSTVLFTLKRGQKVKVDGQLLKPKGKTAAIELAPGPHTIETQAGKRWLGQTVEVPASSRPLRAAFNPKKKQWQLR